MTKSSVLSPASAVPAGACHFQGSETEHECKKYASLHGSRYPHIDSSTLIITLRDFLRVGDGPLRFFVFNPYLYPLSVSNLILTLTLTLVLTQILIPKPNSNSIVLT